MTAVVMGPVLQGVEIGRISLTPSNRHPPLFSGGSNSSDRQTNNHILGLLDWKFSDLALSGYGGRKSFYSYY